MRPHPVVKLLNRIGFFLIIGAVFLILLSRKDKSYLDIGNIFLFIGIILSAPDYFLFVIDQKRKNTGLALYWLSKFLALPLVLVLLIVYFLIRLLS
jgi:hypothetical protein